MSGWFTRFVLGVALAALQRTIKNPQSLKNEFAILRDIRDLINQILPPDLSVAKP